MSATAGSETRVARARLESPRVQQEPGGPTAARAFTPFGRRESIPKGSYLGPFEVVGPLGAGGMGMVVRAIDHRLGREVAIKLLYADAAGDARRLRHFVDEARAASTLNHPNILTVYDIGTSERGPYIVTELVDGETLRALINRSPVPLPLALDIAQQVAGGLAKAHDIGLIHRDLKPENLMITADGFVKILDFGIAKLAGPVPGAPPGAMRLRGTATEGIPGTPAYMSPEQVRGGKVGPASDVFSLTVVLYELLTGRHPFMRSGVDETMNAIAAEDFEPAPSVPPELGAILRKGLAKSPSARYANAREMDADLHTIRRLGLESGAEPVLGAPLRRIASTTGAPRLRARGRFRVAVGLSFALAAAAAGAWVWNGRGAWPRRARVAGAEPSGVAHSEAQRLYLKGRYSSGRGTEESLRTATEYFTQAIARDPNDALSYAGLARTTLLLSGFGDVTPSDSAARAEAAAKKALALDPDLADAHVALGSIRFLYDWNWPAAEAEFRRAIALDPSSAAARHGLGMLLLALGRLEESRSSLALAAELDPVSLTIAADRGLPDLFERRYDDAIAQFRAALALDPTFVPARENLAYSLLLTGRCEQAEEEFRAAQELGRQEPESILIRAFAASIHGRAEDATSILGELEAVPRRHGVYPFRAALLYAVLGKRGAAFRWLERGYEERSPDMVYLATHPIADELRGDPRFDDLLARIGLERRHPVASPRAGHPNPIAASSGVGAVALALARAAGGRAATY